MAKEDELSLKIKRHIDGTKDRLQELLPDIDMRPPMPDADIKQAILDLTPAGLQALFEQFGEQETLAFIDEFAQGRRW